MRVCTWEVLIQAVDRAGGHVDCLTDADRIEVTHIQKDRETGVIKELSCDEFYTLPEAEHFADSLVGDVELWIYDTLVTEQEDKADGLNFNFVFNFDESHIQAYWECNGTEEHVSESLPFTLATMSDVKQVMADKLSVMVSNSRHYCINQNGYYMSIHGMSDISCNELEALGCKFFDTLDQMQTYLVQVLNRSEEDVHNWTINFKGSEGYYQECHQHSWTYCESGSDDSHDYIAEYGVEVL